MQKENMPYQVEDVTYKGEVYYDPALTNKRPGILVAHAFRGRDMFARQKAKALAELGYVGFALDLYGGGIVAESNEKASTLMQPLFLDRKTLRQRILAAYETLSEHPMVDKDHIGAIGFCFGGLAVIELARSGCQVKGVVSFHPVLGNSISNQKATLEPNLENKNCAIMILYGAEDPLVTKEDIAATEKEFTEKGVDWQFHTFGHTSHAFTNPEAHEPGLQFNPKANARSWIAMKNFFEELFQ